MVYVERESKGGERESKGGERERGGKVRMHVRIFMCTKFVYLKYCRVV